LRTHFPSPVLEAYQAMKPGAFKADLFRYCVLLITGGVYADVDIQLESVLDLSIPPDVGFMVPVDEVRFRCALFFQWLPHPTGLFLPALSFAARKTSGQANVSLERTHWSSSGTPFHGEGHRDGCQPSSK